MDIPPDATLCEIIRKIVSHAPPWSKEEFEELFFYKRLFKQHPDKYLTAKVLLEWFETNMKATIPDAEISNIQDFLTQLKTKSFTTISDILLLSYYNERIARQQVSPQDAACFQEYKNTSSTSFMKPNHNFFPETNEMVQGVRVPLPPPLPPPEGENKLETAPNYKIGQVIEARFKGRSKFYRGRIQSYDSDTNLYSIQYDDGDTEHDVKEQHIRDHQSSQDTISKRVRVEDTQTARAIRLPHAMQEDSEIALQRRQFVQHTMSEITNFRHLSEALDTAYWDTDTTNSTALDIIAVYLKGQKILYIEAKTHCESHLSMLMLPSMFVSVLSSVLSLALKDFGWGATLISSLTAVNTFLLGIISWLKLDARAEAHKTSSYQFDKLQSMCEFHSGKVLFFRDNSAKTLVDDIEKKVQEIKDTNQFVIPEAVRMRFPESYNTNIFSLVKTIENKENTVKNNMNRVMGELIHLHHVQELTTEQKDKISQLEKDKMQYMTDYISLREEYMKLDTKFNAEIKADIEAKKRRWNCCSWVSN
jgi:hypothetical protein